MSATEGAPIRQTAACYANDKQAFSWQVLYLSDVAENEAVQGELRKLFVTQVKVRAPTRALPQLLLWLPAYLYRRSCFGPLQVCSGPLLLLSLQVVLDFFEAVIFSEAGYVRSHPSHPPLLHCCTFAVCGLVPSAPHHSARMRLSVQARDRAEPSNERSELCLTPPVVFEADLWRPESVTDSSQPREGPAARRIRALKLEGRWVEKEERERELRSGAKITQDDLHEIIRDMDHKVFDPRGSELNMQAALESIVEDEQHATPPGMLGVPPAALLEELCQRRPLPSLNALILQNRANCAGWATDDPDVSRLLKTSATLCTEARARQSFRAPGLGLLVSLSQPWLISLFSACPSCHCRRSLPCASLFRRWIRLPGGSRLPCGQGSSSR